jgi:uncharacterized membrane protein
VGPLLLLCWACVFVLCIVMAAQGKRFQLPLIGPLAAKQAGA